MRYGLLLACMLLAAPDLKPQSDSGWKWNPKEQGKIRELVKQVCTDKNR